MKLTKKIIGSIKRACVDVCGGRRNVEVGQWEGEVNTLLSREEANLDETFEIDNLAGETLGTKDGWVALDCYCYTKGPDGELDTNVYVLLSPAGEVVYKSNDHLGSTAAMEKIISEF